MQAPPTWTHRSSDPLQYRMTHAKQDDKFSIAYQNLRSKTRISQCRQVTQSCPVQAYLQSAQLVEQRGVGRAARLRPHHNVAAGKDRQQQRVVDDLCPCCRLLKCCSSVYLWFSL